MKDVWQHGLKENFLRGLRDLQLHVKCVMKYPGIPMLKSNRLSLFVIPWKHEEYGFLVKPRGSGRTKLIPQPESRWDYSASDETRALSSLGLITNKHHTIVNRNSWNQRRMDVCM